MCRVIRGGREGGRRIRKRVSRLKVNKFPKGLERVSRRQSSFGGVFALLEPTGPDQFKPSDAAGAARKTRLSSTLQETINMIFPQSRGRGKIVLLSLYLIVGGIRDSGGRSGGEA